VRGSAGLGLASLRAYLLTGEPKFRAEFDQLWSKKLRRFDDLSQKRSLLTVGQRNEFDEFKSADDAFLPLLEQMFRIRASEKWNVPNYLLATEAVPLADQILKRLLGSKDGDGRRSGGILDNQQSLLTAEAAESFADIASLQKTLAFLLALGLVASGMIAWLTSRSIYRPLLSAVDIAHSVAEGRRDIAIDAGSSDETGVLLASLDEMQRAVGRAEASLRDNEERFKDFAESASDWLWEMDENLRITFLSDRSEAVTGILGQDILGKIWWEQPGFYVSHDTKRQRHRADLEARRPFRDFQFGLRNKHGQVTYCKASGNPVFSANSIGLIGVKLPTRDA